MNKLNPPMPVVAAPDAADRELAALLDEPLASACERPDAAAATGGLRSRLTARLAASQAAEAPMTTRRRKRLPRNTLAPGVTAQTLYSAPAGRSLRPGEPLRARLLELAPGATLAADALGDAHAGFASHQRELLVLSGSVVLQGQVLSQRDYHLLPAGVPMPALHAEQGALLFLREADLPAQPGDAAVTVFDAAAGWPAFAPGIRRRVLWQRDGQAALLYHAEPGASVPLHRHGHDEECLMLQGELFLDDLLLQQGDYQLAPAGTGHRITETDTGVVIYAHGDLDLAFGVLPE